MERPWHHFVTFVTDEQKCDACDGIFRRGTVVVAWKKRKDDGYFGGGMVLCIACHNEIEHGGE